MANLSHLRYGDSITKHDPFPYRWLQRFGVTSRKTAGLITVAFLVVSIFVCTLLITHNSLPQSNFDDVPLEEQLLLDEDLN